MTDLKLLLDDAAGDDFAVSEQDLAADLHRGQQARRRRRLGAITGGSAATAAVAVAAWSVLPGGLAAVDTPADRPTTSATPSPVPQIPKRPNPNSAPAPGKPVQLVPNTKTFPGRYTCDLIPAGWVAKLVGVESSQIYLTDPKLRNPGRYEPTSWRLALRDSTLRPEEGFRPDKFSERWDELNPLKLGRHEVVGSFIPSQKHGRGEFYLRRGKDPKAIVVTNRTTNLRWDLATVLRFAGSCRYK